MPLPTGVLDTIFARDIGTNVDLTSIVRAAADLQAEYRRLGHPSMSVAFAPEQITSGIVTLNVAQTAVPQIVVAGVRYPAPTATSGRAKTLSAAPTPLANQPQTPHAAKKPVKMAASNNGAPTHVSATNAGPRFNVQRYLVLGDSVLAPETVVRAMTNVPDAFGTNVSFGGIREAVEQLQAAYRQHGYITVSVGLPQQKLTNATVKLEVTEGRLADIQVKGNRYFSSNNVLRAMPSLRANMILNSLVFQSELNRANANEDRQIYPIIGPGPEPGTSELTLRVKDRLPMHAKVELNNQSSPGTPALRINSSAAYANLWQLEHSFGLQYGFSPEAYKQGNQWDFYDEPMVAYYSGFYRLPLGNPQSVENVFLRNPNSFGYNEATHQFVLPPPSGQTELTLYASRSAIDTGVQNLSSAVIYNVPGVRQVSQQDVQQDLTINEALGFRLDKPFPSENGASADLSGGLDYKTYSLTDYKTNIFSFLEITRSTSGQLNPPIISSVSSPVPMTERRLQYLPVTLNYSATLRGALGAASFGMGITGNAWYSGSATNLHAVTGSPESTGHWITLTPSLSWDIPVHTNWNLMLRANAQWASEPLVNTEEFAAGGVNSVRGYHEGEVFGDNGWRLSLEQQTPPYVVGLVYGDVPLTVRGSVYMDYARAFLLDPQGRPGSASLWGAGFGATASVGSHWQALLLFSLPLLSAGTTEAWQPYFNFALTAQF
ncbi:MAG: ShlB/FhaC/HecB family hemolysin secretion/activation protein [Verrucomicrobiota bacterium]|nr:ShlB/FhaC/HecB family hemolysin secretion/activation protein [Verrucomicrobiota bacterium]